MFSRLSSFSALLALSLVTLSSAAPLYSRQANPCFVTGNVALPAEVANSLAGLSGVRCVGGNVFPGVPDVQSGSVRFSSIDFQGSGLSPVGFALQTFTTPANPAQANLALLQDQLNTYLAVEAGIRSTPNSRANLDRVKGAKFFIQFQIARVHAARGDVVGPGGTVEHQLGKVLKNAAGASAAEKAAVEALARQV